MSFIVLQKILLDFLLDMIYFPVWWYTGGVKFIFFKCLDIFLRGNLLLAPSLWLKNIFVPMFGQWDFQGRLISFFMRLFQVFVRFIILLLWLIFVIMLFLFWLILPIIIFKGIFL